MDRGAGASSRNARPALSPRSARPARRRRRRACADPARPPRTARAQARRGSRWVGWCSRGVLLSGASIETVALVVVARAADVGELPPAGARHVELLLLRTALDEQQPAGVGLERLERSRADVAMVVERR